MAPDQAQHFVEPGQGPKCFKRLSQLGIRMQQKKSFLLLGPFISHVITYWTVRTQNRPGILSKVVSMIR